MSTTLKTTRINNKVRSRLDIRGKDNSAFHCCYLYETKKMMTTGKNYALVAPENDQL